MLADAGAHWTLRRVTSTAVAADLLLTGRTVSADEAGRLGLVSAVLPAGQVLPRAVQVAREIAERCAPLSVAVTKRLLWQDLPLDETVKAETAYHLALMGGPDTREGPLAWQQRRPPVWAGSVNGDWHRVLDEEERHGTSYGSPDGR